VRYQVGERVRSLVNVDGVLAKGDVVTIVELDITVDGDFDAEIDGRHIALRPDQVEPALPAEWSG
jgi:hypothetical protein